MITITIGDKYEFRVIAFNGRESLDALYTYHATIACENNNFAIDDLLTQAVVVQFAPITQLPRPICGIATEIEFLEQGRRFAQYRVKIEPVFSLLKLRTDIRIFQNNTTREIIEHVFKSANIPADQFDFNLTDDGMLRQFCVQYNETDWDFVNRLAQEDGWVFFFQHSASLHKLTFANHRDAHTQHAPYEIPVQDETGQFSEGQFVTHFQPVVGLSADTWVLTDYNYSKPALDQTARQSSKTARGLERYTYPGMPTQGDGDASNGARFAKTRLDAEQTLQRQHRGRSRISCLQAGQAIHLRDERRRSQQHADYLITSIKHYATQPSVLEEDAGESGDSYHNEFTCVDAELPYRNPITVEKPRIDGYQTARVVGPTGEKIYTDEHGRIKIQFHWDRLAKSDDRKNTPEQSSGWVRVMQSWAGSGYGSFVLPRVDQEVVVQFENGDPDRPLVIGTVYNGVNRTSFAPPENKTQTGIRTQMTDGDGFHELRFEDKADNAGIYLQSGKDFGINVTRDGHAHIGNDAHLVVIKNQIERVDGDKHQIVKGDHAQKIEKNASFDIGADLHMKTNADFANDTTGEVHMLAEKIVWEAADEITIKSGSEFIKIDSSGVTIKGSLIKLNEGGSAGSAKTAKVLAVKPAIEAEQAK